MVLAPLLLIGLGHNVVTGQRDRGTERLWLALAGSPLRLVAARSVNRLALVALPLALAGVGRWLLGPNGRGGTIALWLGVAFLGLLFWWAVILVANVLFKNAETAALALVALWALLVFVVPSAATTAGQLLDPAPSRFEQIAVARAAEVRASREYDDDHPELSAQTLEGRRAKVEKGIVVRRQMAHAVAPFQRDFAEARAAQERLASRFALLSPPALTADALAAIAATDAAFYSRQREAAAAHLVPLADALIAKARGEGRSTRRVFGINAAGQPVLLSGNFGSGTGLTAPNGRLDPREATIDRQVFRFGDQPSTLRSVFANFVAPIAEVAEAYAFGGYSRLDGDIEYFFRRAGQDETVRALYPDGYRPRLDTQIENFFGARNLFDVFPTGTSPRLSQAWLRAPMAQIMRARSRITRSLRSGSTAALCSHVRR